MTALVKDMRNMIIRLFIFITLLTIVPATYGFCETYKWRNDNGSISYTDDLDRIPDKYMDKFEIMNFENDKSVTIQNDPDTEDADMLPDEDADDLYDDTSEEQKTKTDENIDYIMEKNIP